MKGEDINIKHVQIVTPSLYVQCNHSYSQITITCNNIMCTESMQQAKKQKTKDTCKSGAYNYGCNCKQTQVDSSYIITAACNNYLDSHS